MKGIILSGGSGTRLSPITHVVSKQLLPVYDKPMVYYPLATLMLSGIKDILLISTPHDIPRFQQLLKDGTQWGINITYATQDHPRGIAEAFLIGENFIGNDCCVLILGDNIFYGSEFTNSLKKAFEKKAGATVFAYPVQQPERYGVVEFNTTGKVVNIVEKPKNPKSRYAVTGLYFYDNQVVSIAKSLSPSHRNELEITDVNMHYLNKEQLDVVLMNRGQAWLDTGTCESLLDAALFIQTLEKRQGLKVACPEEIAYRMGYISEKEFEELATSLPNNYYAQYLMEILNEKL